MSILVATPIQTPERLAAGANRGRLVSCTVEPQAGESLPSLCERLAVQLRAASATPLHLLAFGDCRASAAVTTALVRAGGWLDCPTTWVEGKACGGAPVAGLQVQAFTGAVERVLVDGRPVGSVFTDGGARQCVVGGLGPDDQSASRAEQTANTLGNLQSALAQAGFELDEVVRTWFYLDDILSWYNDFNRVRTGIYSGVKFRTGSLPASTGIGARNPAGAALTLAAWAYRPLAATAYAQEVASPLQCPAPAYGSAFSRAMEMATNGGRQLFISGTASIAPGGKTLWENNVRKQVELTMEVVLAILGSRGFTLNDLSRATAYFRRAADAPVFAQWLAARKLTRLPVVATEAHVCRDDLLFELEAEAITETMVARPKRR
jgi:enamine deaminase RidA (YjgF/YER057c/UK114 family)